jgi:hypothetical protein
MGVKGLVRGVVHQPPSSTVDKNEWSSTSADLLSLHDILRGGLYCIVMWSFDGGK